MNCLLTSCNNFNDMPTELTYFLFYFKFYESVVSYIILLEVAHKLSCL